jgi:isoleucyl-tRNA synthetase
MAWKGVYLEFKWRLEGGYDPHRVEELVKEYWEASGVYKLVKEKSEKNNVFFNFIDGPPYPSGDVPHIGTAWNKALKDAVLRFKRMKGFRVNDKPGYDCHGLPIEVKVEQKLGVRFKKEIEEKIGIDRFVEECRKFALSNLSAMTHWFKELGVFMDWDNPYLTLRDEYIEAEWWLIKKAEEQGLLDSEYRVVYWCPRCSTTLAEYEVEYRDLEDPSIYVKFPIREEENSYLVIWTTTPWTLPANVFVMAHPDEVYVKVKVGGEYWILAEKRLEHVMREIGVYEYTIVERMKGEDLTRYTYESPLVEVVPLQRKIAHLHRVIPSREYVSMHEGTGLVHGAPGHGFEDYDAALKHGMRDAIVCPVDEEGKFTSDAGLFAGLNVREANKLIIEYLREKGALVYSSSIVHRYPLCWRCKTPVILRATKQWVIKVSKLKDVIREEAERVNWIPSWALTRLLNIIDNLQDWVISRQRYWGAPLPIWTCPNGHRVVIGSLEELRKYANIEPRELHRPWIDRVTFKCPVCGLEMNRVPDVADVWMDSGVAFYASLGHPDRNNQGFNPVDFITEGHDQIRGWFFSLLRSGVLGFKTAPYKTVLVHGFMLDEQGREMHKSLGNYVGTDEAIKRVGRDPLRLWLLSNTIWEDIKFSWRELEEAKRDLSILWNIAVFAKTYMDLDSYSPQSDPLSKYLSTLRVEDKWILSRCNNLVRQVEEAMERYDVMNAVRKIRDFIVEDLSHWYIRLIRPRVWIEENTVEKISAYATLHYVLDVVLRLLAPITPFITEYIYQSMLRKYYDAESIHLLEWPKVNEGLVDQSLEEYMAIAREVYKASSSARMKAGLKHRQPVRKLLVYTDSERVREAIDKLSGVLRFACNAKQIEVVESKRITEITRYTVKPKYRVLGPKYRGLVRDLLKYIELNQDTIAKDVLSSGRHEASIGGQSLVLTSEDLEITPHYVEGFLVEDFKYGVVALDTRLTVEEIAEGLARDIVRRIQVMRKKLNLELMEKISVVVVAPSDRVELVESKKDYIASETRAVDLRVTTNRDEAYQHGGLVEEWDIDEDLYIISVKPLNKQ